MLSEVIEEIKEGVKKRSVSPEDTPGKKKSGGRQQMTKAEIAAYRERKILEEEAKYLKEKAVKKKVAKDRTEEPADKPVKRRRRKAVVSEPETPKMLSPLQPLYLLKIPGLPDGDCIAICLAKGACQ